MVDAMSFSASSISHYYLQVTGHLVFGVFGVRVKIASDGFYSDPKTFIVPVNQPSNSY